MTTNRDRALEANSKKIEQAVVRYGHVTVYSCHEHFIGGSLEHGSKEYDEFYKAFNDLWDQLVAEGRRSPDERETISLRLFYAGGRNLPSTFRDHLDFFVDLVAMVVRRTFRLLLDIAGEDGVAWAREQALQLVRDIDWPVVVPTWVRAACVGEVGGAEPWLIPAFLRMKPAGPHPYDAERAWRSLDAANTGDVLNYLVAEIVGKLEGCIEEAAGDEYQKVASLEAAQRREPKVTTEASLSAEKVAAPDGKGPAPEDQDEPRSQKEWIDWAMKQPAGTRVSVEEAEKIFGRTERTFRNWGLYRTNGHYPIESIWKCLNERPPKL